MRLLKGLMLAGITAFTLAGCGSGDNATSDSTTSASTPCAGDANFCVYSPSVADGGVLPVKYASTIVTNGQNISPALELKNIPAQANYISIVADDETAPCGTGFNACVHAGFFDMPKTKTSYAEEDELSGLTGYTLGRVNSNNNSTYGYNGPFPPVGGGAHTYKVTVYAHKSSWASYGVVDSNGTPTANFNRPRVTRAEIEADQGSTGANDIVASKTITFTFQR